MRRLLHPILALFTVPALAQTGSPLAMPSADALLKVPVTGVMPGTAAPTTGLENPFKDDPDAVVRGQRDFIAFNCVGCHAPNGAGGMGPSLSNGRWIYGSAPANVYLTIAQGRPKGMPSFGAMLPPETIWELVSYIESISKDPGPTFGETTSATPQRPAIQQVPAEHIETTDPWAHTQPFTAGQKP